MPKRRAFIDWRYPSRTAIHSTTNSYCCSGRSCSGLQRNKSYEYACLWLGLDFPTPARRSYDLVLYLHTRPGIAAVAAAAGAAAAPAAGATVATAAFAVALSRT